MAKTYRSDITGLYNHLSNNGFELPNNLNPDVNGLISCMNVLKVINPDKIISVGNRYCNGLFKITKYHLENELRNALATNNENLARACYSKLIQITNSNNLSEENSVINDEKTKVPCVPKRFVFAERLLNETVFKFKGTESNSSSNVCKNNRTGDNQQNIDSSRSILSLNSNNHNQVRNEAENDEYSGYIARSNKNRTTRISPTKSNLQYENYFNKTDKNQTFATYNKKSSKQNDSLIKNKSKYDLQKVKTISKPLKINDKNEKITKRNSLLDKVNSKVESKKNDKNISNNSRNNGSKMNKSDKKKNENIDNKIQKRNSTNNSKGMVTPVKRVSKISQKMISSIELFQKKRRRESIKDNSTSSIPRPRSKRRRTSSPISIKNSRKSSRRIVKNVDSDLKSYNSYNCSNNFSTDASGYTLLSTPVSTYSCRGGKKRRVFYRRNLFSSPRRHK